MLYLNHNGLEFIATLLMLPTHEIKEDNNTLRGQRTWSELQMKDSAAWSWLTYWESINVIGLGITRHNDVKGDNGKIFVRHGFCVTEMHIKSPWII